MKADSEYRKIKYQYIKRNQTNHKEVIEREPRRELRICDPNLYRGQLGLQRSSYFANTDNVYIVNGYVNKADENFRGNFQCFPIDGTKLVIGSYISQDMDFDKLK